MINLNYSTTRTRRTTRAPEDRLEDYVYCSSTCNEVSTMYKANFRCNETMYNIFQVGLEECFETNKSCTNVKRTTTIRQNGTVIVVGVVDNPKQIQLINFSMLLLNDCYPNDKYLCKLAIPEEKIKCGGSPNETQDFGMIELSNHKYRSGPGEHKQHIRCYKTENSTL